jgi:hypothetical protein
MGKRLKFKGNFLCPLLVLTKVCRKNQRHKHHLTQYQRPPLVPKSDASDSRYYDHHASFPESQLSHHRFISAENSHSIASADQITLQTELLDQEEEDEPTPGCTWLPQSSKLSPNSWKPLPRPTSSSQQPRFSFSQFRTRNDSDFSLPIQHYYNPVPSFSNFMIKTEIPAGDMDKDLTLTMHIASSEEAAVLVHVGNQARRRRKFNL